MAPESKRFDFALNDVRKFEQAESKRLKLVESKKLGPEFSKKPHPKAIFTSRALSSLISKTSSINNFAWYETRYVLY